MKRAGDLGAGSPAKRAHTEDLKEGLKTLFKAFETDNRVGLSEVSKVTKEMLQKNSTEATEKLAKATDDVNTCHIQLLRKQAELRKLTSIINDSVQPMKDGADFGSEKEKQAAHKENLGAIESILKNQGADASLMQALQCALTKKPIDRGTFDAVAIEHMDAILMREVDEHKNHVANAENIQAEKIAVVSECQRTLDNCEAYKTSCEKALVMSEKVHEVLLDYLKEAIKAVNVQCKALNAAKEEAKEADSLLEEAKSNEETFVHFAEGRPCVKDLGVGWATPPKSSRKDVSPWSPRVRLRRSPCCAPSVV